MQGARSRVQDREFRVSGLLASGYLGSKLLLASCVAEDTGDVRKAEQQSSNLRIVQRQSWASLLPP